MESASQVSVPLRSGGKKMRKRKELDALVAHSLAKRANKKNCAGNGIHSQDQLLSPSTDEQDDIGWPKVIRTSNRTRNRKFSLLQTCIPIIFVMSVALSLGFVYWLHFDLKQQLYDYRSRIEEVALASQNVPDALQKWHETSKNLEQNQTLLAGKLLDIQKYIEEIKNRLAIYETKLNEKKDYQKDEKIVADIGAEIKAVSADVTGMESKFANLLKSQTDFRTEIDTIKANFNETVTNATRRANNNETSFTDELNKAQTTIYNEIKMLAANVSLINDTLSQKTDMISKDATAQQRDIGDLQEQTAKITSQIRSIEDNWKPMIVSDFDTFKNNSNYELQSLQNATKDLKNNIEDVRRVCQKIQSDMQYFSNNETRDTQTAKKDMSRDKSPLMAALSDNIRKTTATTASNASTAPEPSGTAKTLSGTTANQSSKLTSATTENSAAAVVTVAEGKPKLLSIQTISKHV